MKRKVSKIIVPDGRRDINYAKVLEIAESIELIGLINPITIDRNDMLIAGGHRLEAHKLLGRKTIECIVRDRGELQSELAEVDANLIRNDLDAIGIGENALKRDEILDALGLRAKSGTNIKNLGTGAVSASVRTTADIAKQIGVSKRVLQENRQLARDLTIEAKNAVRVVDATKLDALKLSRKSPREQNVIAKMILGGKAASIIESIREFERGKLIAKLEDISTQKVKKAKGQYDVIVIDPPWPMKKIELDKCPEQVEFDYPTMTESELSELKIPAAPDCHLWLWTTQRFLPIALRLLEKWGFKYTCLFTWHKSRGFQPFGLPKFNSEFAIYARRGNPQFIDTKSFFTCFEAPSGKHSEKPEKFYEVVRRVTAGRRLDMFNRRQIKGFDGWGNEAK